MNPGAEMAFDDNGERVPVYRPPEPSPALVLLESLTELGAVIPRTAEAMTAIEDFADVQGDSRAAEALAIIIDRLPNTKAGRQMRLALRGAIATEADAAQMGITRQTLATNLDRLKKRLRIHPLVEGHQNDGP